MTKFVFTDREALQLALLSKSAFAEFYAGRSKVGVFTPLYDFVVDILASADPDRLDAVDRQVLAWAQGARDVNAGAGFYSNLIRDYSLYQYQSRYGTPPADPEKLIQETSNKVAENFFSDVIDELQVQSDPTLSPPCMMSPCSTPVRQRAPCSTAFTRHGRGRFFSLSRRR